MYLKILNPVNRKGFRMYTLRGLRKEDIDCPTKLKQEIFSQCGDCVVPKPATMELGYFHQAKKFWLNNRLDMTDAWEIHSKGGNLVFWCVGADSSQPSKSVPRKRTQQQQENGSDDECELQQLKKSKKAGKQSKQEERKAMAEEYESALKEKHQDAYTRFQYKLWAEMLAAGVHTDLDSPPSASMFGREHKRVNSKNTSSDVATLGDAVAGMVGLLSQTLTSSAHTQQTPTAGKAGQVSNSDLSPMKCAELRSIYIKQIGKLRQLYDNGVLSKEEYEEQRIELVDSMRRLRK